MNGKKRIGAKVAFLAVLWMNLALVGAVRTQELALGTVQGALGARVSLPLTLIPPDSGGIAGAQLDLQFDPQLLQLPNEEEWVSRGADLTADFTINVDQVSPGVLRVLITPPVAFPLPTIAGGEIVHLNLIVSPEAPPGAIPISFVPGSDRLSDDQGVSLSSAGLTDGSVEVTVTTGSISGRVTEADGVTPIPDLRVEARDFDNNRVRRN